MKIVYKNPKYKPVKSTEWSMCYDLFAAQHLILNPWEVKTIWLWIKTNFWWKMYWRSSLPKQWLVFIIWVGIIDSDYRWEALACLYNFTDCIIDIHPWSRVTQAEFPEWVEFIYDELLFDGWDIKTPTGRWVWWYWSTWI